MKFHPDQNNPKEMICDDCFQAQEDINIEWMDLDDDEWPNEGWFEDEEFDDFEEGDDLWDDENAE